MFIKSTKAKDYEYIKLVESYRENGKTKHRVLFNFGRADNLKKDTSFINVANKLCEIAGLPVGKNTCNSSRIENCSEATIYNYGYLAYKRLWKETGIRDTLEELQNGCTKATYAIPEAAFLMTIQHLLEPRSKLSTHRHQARYFGMKEIPLQHLYRTLDKLNDWKEDIEWELFQYNYIRTKQKVDVVFYDVTTVAFESIHADVLRDFGFSKDCKFNEVQVVIGLIIDINGLPVGYELFPGDTFDGKTMIKALGNIRKRFGINRVIIVADRGINSKGNLKLIKGAGYGYIMAGRIKSMGKAMKEKILDGGGFTVVNEPSCGEDFRYKVLEHVNEVVDDETGEIYSLPENMVVSYSPKRAQKDRKDRERLVEKAKGLLAQPEKIKASNKRGGKKYIDRVKPGEPESWKLALEKIERDAEFDGYYGIQTSELGMSAADVIEAYHTLWKIEESFRIMKSTLEIRPVFHWTPDRVRGHFVVCFLAFLMERRLELLLKDKNDGIPVSPDRIRESLNTLQLAAVTVDGDESFIKAKSDPLSVRIFNMLKLRLPLNISRKPELIARILCDDDMEDAQLTFA